MEYVLKSSAIIFIFYVSYQLFLQRDTFFQSNRWFLLFGLLSASCISIIVIPNYIEYTPLELSTVKTYATNPVSPKESDFEALDITQFLALGYYIGLVFFSIRLVIQLLSLRRIINKGQHKTISSFKLIETKDDIAPFSFFNHIVINPTQFSASELEHVINHEKAHAKQWHSVDIILVHFACLLLWFNPFIWLYKKALQQNLEFIADQEAQYSSPCERTYQTVLLKASVKHQDLTLVNSFYTSLIKKRIVMLHKSKSKQPSQLKLFLVLPLAVFIMSFNKKDIYVEVPSAEYATETTYSEGETIEIIITKSTSDKDLESIKKDLESKGITFTYDTLKRNDKDEIIAIDAEFKSADNATNYSVKNEKGIKAFRFESSDGNFSIGVVNQKSSHFTFTSKDGNTKGQSSASSKVIVVEEENNNTTTVDIKEKKDASHVVKKRWTSDDDEENLFEDGKEPLFIIDGKEVSKTLFEDVDSDDIESVFILKGDDAIKKYGKDGKNGVIIMNKKDGNTFYFDSDSEEDVEIESESRVNVRINKDNEPLIIVDGKVVKRESLDEMSPNVIHEVEVIKNGDAVKVYGKRAKDGVIRITTKNGSNNVTADEIIFVEGSRSNASSFHEKHEVVITKHTTDAELDQKKATLEKLGIDAKFSKIRRNNSGEITSIKIKLDDNKGRTTTASWKEKDRSIPNIAVGKHDGKLILRPVGN